MAIYTLSSTDPDGYNIIKANLPIEHTTLYCNITVTSLTTNCNIQVLDAGDYIKFKVGDDILTCYMEDRSNISVATISTIFQDIFDRNNIPINVSTSTIDTIIFDSKTHGNEGKFEILDMSYNVKLLTGLYYIKDEDYPLLSSQVPSTEQIVIPNKYIESVACQPTITTTTDIPFTINYELLPIDAYGYNITILPKLDYGDDLIINGVVMMARQPGNYNIKVEFRNYDVPLQVQTPFSYDVEIIVNPKDNIPVSDMVVKDCELYINQSIVSIPDITPVNASYQLIYSSEHSNIATISNNIITANGVGTTRIKVVCKYNSIEGEEELVKYINVNVLSDIRPIIINRYQSSTVGYMLTTPILYLLTSIGTQVFCNKIEDNSKMNSGNIAMILNNSFSPNFPIVSQQYDITTRTTINYTSDLYFILVDANMHHVKLLNPMYITIKLEPEMIKIVQ